MNVKEHLTITINEIKYKVNVTNLVSSQTLNSYLRSNLFLTGTKRMCLEGGCGVCIVAVERMNHISNQSNVQAVNSCLIPLAVCDGWKIETIEGIGNSNNYHFLQKVLAKFNGSQCGFCSPGMVMNMYSLFNQPETTMQQVENSFGGNICRCTGYRPILSAFKSICHDQDQDQDQNGLPDIEDLKKCQRKCVPRDNLSKLNDANTKPKYFNVGETTWIKVFNLPDLRIVIRNFCDASYMLMAGNTSVGVYKSEKDFDIYIDITSIEELTSYKLNSTELILGANISLTEATELFGKLAQENPRLAYLEKIAKHYDLIANVPVRNIGTLAGNLMIKHYHNEFPSDVFLTLETVGAVLVIADVTAGNQRLKVSLTDWLKLSMKGKLIEKIILPFYSNQFKYESYKIMPRAQNAHALVNAGFLLELDDQNIVKTARIVYGCINKSFVHAYQSERALIGTKLFDNLNLQRIFRKLSNELQPDHFLPDPTPSFRKQLAISLFFKFVLSIAPTSIVSVRNLSGASRIERPISTGTQDFTSKKSRYPVGKSLSKIEAMAQTSGQAEFIMDMPDLPNQLFAVFVLAKAQAMSSILNINADSALKLDGVVAFFDKNDVPGSNNFTPPEMGFAISEEIFCGGLVKYFNQPIGIVVAKSHELAQKAANLVKVTYKEGIKPLLTIQDAIRAKDEGRFKLVTDIKSKSRGKSADFFVRGSLELSGQYHFHMETQSCNVVPTEDGLDIYPSSQWIDLSQTAAATTLKIPANQINIFIRRLGGGFGAKLSRNSLVSCAGALAAYKLQKPVKLWMPFETNMHVMGKRYPILCDYEVGINTNEGIIQCLDIVFHSDYGCGGNEPNIPYLLDTLLSNYCTDTWNVKGFSVNTDNPASCFIRAPGTCEGLAIIESIMEHVALSINMDPLEFRLRNIGDDNKQLIKLIMDLKKWADVDRRKKDVDAFNAQNRWKKRGISVVPMTYPFHLFGNYGVIVSIYQSDGSVSIAHGGVEMGQGINTKVAQVCAYKFGISIERISIKPSNNLIAPNSHMVGGSLTSETVCYGVILACDILLERLETVKKNLKNPTWEELVKKAYGEYVNLSATSMPSPKEPFLVNYTVYGGCVTEVEVDILTGEHVIIRVDLMEDAGDSMNPGIDIGQIEGAFVMGIGYFTTEQLVFSDVGELLTNRTWNYKPPGAKDIPVDFRVKMPDYTESNSVGVLKSKALSEPPLCMACSIPLALRQALASTRLDDNNTVSIWYTLSGPSTVENTFINCLHNFKQYTL